MGANIFLCCCFERSFRNKENSYFTGHETESKYGETFVVSHGYAVPGYASKVGLFYSGLGNQMCRITGREMTKLPTSNWWSPHKHSKKMDVGERNERGKILHR